MKFFILCSFIWTGFSAMAEIIHHSEIPQEDQQYLNQDINIHDVRDENEPRVYYGCNYRGEYIGRCFEYCRPPNPQDQQVNVICDPGNYLVRLDDETYAWNTVIPNNYIGIGTSPEEAEEDAWNTIFESHSPFPSIEAVRMAIEKYPETRSIWVKWVNSRYCTPARVCIKVDYSLR